MSEVDEVWQIFSRLMRNYPLWPSTFSTCDCKRAMGRGGGKCALCIEEELAEHVGPALAAESVSALQSVTTAWAKIRDAVKE